MLSWALAFAILAIITGAFGFGFIASGFAAAAKVLFIVFLVLFVVALLRGRRVV